jgi:cell division protein FtsQ
VAALIALVAVAWFSPLLTLKKVQVSGSRLIDTDKVSNFVLDDQGSRPLPQVRPGSVEDAVLKEFPKAEAASVHYAGPRALKIEITDRTPVIAIRGESGYRLYDSDAVDLGTVDKRRRSSPCSAAADTSRTERPCPRSSASWANCDRSCAVSW